MLKVQMFADMVPEVAVDIWIVSTYICDRKEILSSRHVLKGLVEPVAIVIIAYHIYILTFLVFGKINFSNAVSCK